MVCLNEGWWDWKGVSVGSFQGGHGATVARLIPDQKVGCSNHPVLIFSSFLFACE